MKYLNSNKSLFLNFFTFRTQENPNKPYLNRCLSLCQFKPVMIADVFLVAFHKECTDFDETVLVVQ